MQNTQNNNAPNGGMRLDDEARVRVLSPGMLVLKRFVRNRLAITGLVILIAMFLFSFFGAIFSPYSQTQVFRKYEEVPKDYASLVANEELRYAAAEGETFSLAARAQFILAYNNGRSTFSADGKEYAWIEQSDGFFVMVENAEIASALNVQGKFVYKEVPGAQLSDGLKSAFEQAAAEGLSEFIHEDKLYTIHKMGKNLIINGAREVAMASMRMMDAYDAAMVDYVSSFAFRRAAEGAIAQNEQGFEVNGQSYALVAEGDNVLVEHENAPFAVVSNWIVSAASPDVHISVELKNAVLAAIDSGERGFQYQEDGEEVEYRITRVHNTYTVKRNAVTQLIDTYAFPSGAHILGTDGSGMDVMTRLMYGGRISLLVGFIVVLIELVIGIAVGGVAGYFGKWVDTILMRLIDLFNCIPYYPVMIIAGALMDALKVEPYVRIVLLMIILGLLGWTGIARVVRGQILQLREQDFMVAAEATGIRTSRRIFRHLVPNVMPLLIVQATLGLGSIIITEATLSFLGLGLKYPMASWGTIINAATSISVMTNYWFAWIPAGVLILLTVLGFNFVGDGLRDAFDPKMKR